jgi:probable phosphomutase (TIGR03848 family)
MLLLLSILDLMPLFLLLRHAVTETTGKRLPAPDVRLSARGREDAERLAERLLAVPLTAIYSSPLVRCRETAAPLGMATGLEVRTVDRLRDTEYGEWTGRSLRQVGRTKLWRALRERPSSVRFPGGETLADVQVRAVRALEGIASVHPRGTVAVVCHADVVRLVVMHLVGLHLDFIERVAVAPASVSVVSVDAGPPRLLALGCTGDLSLLAPRARPASRKVGG